MHSNYFLFYSLRRLVIAFSLFASVTVYASPTMTHNYLEEARALVEHAQPIIQNASTCRSSSFLSDKKQGQKYNVGLSDRNPYHSSVYVFISFSMSKQSLSQWINQARKINGTLVLRGLVHNSLTKTSRMMKELLGETKSNIIIDPTLFRKFNIRQVPAVLIIDNNYLNAISKVEHINDQQDKFTQFAGVYGDIPLEKALEFIISRHTDKNQVVDKMGQQAVSLLKRMRESV